MSSLVDAVMVRVSRLVDPAAIAAKSAPLIEARLREDATTRRGNVPQFAPGPVGHPMASVPITATSAGPWINVRAAAWVMAKAVEKGQPAEWAEIVRGEAQRSLK